MDAVHPRPYTLRQMRRIILAFLALLGLAAQVAPVQARVCAAGVAQVGAVTPLRGAYRALAVRTAIATQGIDRAQPRLDGCGPAVPARHPQVYVPAVHIGIDRARE